MARYIKANPKVAKFLNLESDRNTVKDGNYLLWQSDMLAFGPLTQLADTLVQIGGIALLAHEAREEQDGTVTRPLPQATDERFVMPPAPDTEGEAEPTEETTDPDTGDDANGGTDESGSGDGEGESDNAQPEATAEATESESESKDDVETPKDE